MIKEKNNIYGNNNYDSNNIVNIIRSDIYENNIVNNHVKCKV